MAEDEILVDYWKVAGALCRAVHNLSVQYGYDYGALVAELDGELYKAVPMDWKNVMTDNWPLTPEQYEEVKHDVANRPSSI